MRLMKLLLHGCASSVPCAAGLDDPRIYTGVLQEIFETLLIDNDLGQSVDLSRKTCPTVHFVAKLATLHRVRSLRTVHMAAAVLLLNESINSSSEAQYAKPLESVNIFAWSVYPTSEVNRKVEQLMYPFGRHTKTGGA